MGCSASGDERDADDEAIAPPVHSLDGSDISDPSDLGYMYRDNRTIAIRRGMPSGNSVEIKCCIHSSKCVRFVYAPREPLLVDLKRWLAQGRPHAASDPAAEQKASAAEHAELFTDMFPDAQGARKVRKPKP